MNMSSEELRQLTIDFTEAFNRDDLDGVMGFFADDIVYYQYDGAVSSGRSAVRQSFEPQFSGKFGVIRFEMADIIVDAENQKSLVTWLCRISKEETDIGWQGLDILHMRSGKIIEKHTYAKAKKLLIASSP